MADQPSVPAGQQSGPASSAPASGGGPAPARPCATTAVRVSVGTPGVAAGGSYYPLDFTNISAAACTLDGYPGVFFVTAPGGSQIGAAAVRNPAFPASVIALAPGGTAHASLLVDSASNYPDCKPVTAHYLSVYPPGQFTPRYADLTAQACTTGSGASRMLGIFVVRPGATGP